jgi:uncharacterized phage protein (TIGR01671 family)
MGMTEEVEKMEDRYLFKAKRLDNGEWVQGYLIYSFTGVPIIVTEYDHILMLVTRYEVDLKTICQCTGLKDKNGKLIWENDILMCYDNTDNLVKVAYGEFDVIDADSLNVSDSVIGWHHEVVSMDALKKHELLRYDMLPLTEYYIQLMESKRIGNIFDNPELIKEV